MDLFDPYHVDIKSNMAKRFKVYMSQCRRMVLLHHPDYKPKYGATIVHFEEPIPDRLQSSKEDVVYEGDQVLGVSATRHAAYYAPT